MAEAAIRLIHKAIDRSDEGDYEGALKLLTQAAEAHPTIPQAYHERAMALLNLNQSREAVADFERALALDPMFPGARSWLARTLAELGEHGRAGEEWLKELRDRPDGLHAGMGVCPLTWADCAEQFAKAGDVERAIGLLEEYLTQHANRVTAYACHATAPLRLLARLLLRRGKAGRAAELARTGYANLKHRCPMDLVVYGLALEAVGQTVEALRVADEALGQNDQMSEAIALRQRLLGK